MPYMGAVTPKLEATMGRLLALRLLDVIGVPDEFNLDNRMFLDILAALPPSFQGVEETGILHDGNFAEAVNAALMPQLRGGELVPRLAGYLPEYILLRLGGWKPWLIWRSYLASQHLTPYALIENVATARAAQRQGLGRLVMETAAEAAWARNAYKIMLLTGQTLGARGFYERLGYAADQKHGMVLRRAPQRQPAG